ncbi:MAG: signal recognition particle protein [Chromatiales bacterium]|nr:signal recognition particle protein [Chromatiales bacterium]
MFENLSDRLRAVTERLRGRGRLTEDNIRDAVRDVRRALIEADVALPVVKDFVARVRVRALGTEVSRSLNPGQVFVKVLHQELTSTLADGAAPLNLRQAPPVIILLAGLQGAGKTTTAGKLALYLRERERRKVLLTSTDVRRPAAILQLERLAAANETAFVPPPGPESTPLEIVESALDSARRQQADVVIVDTAGRSRVDEALLEELKQLHGRLMPAETLFVVDSMAGQDALNAARAFTETVSLTGIVLTKADGDARGGVALSVKAVTGCPIKFIGTGEGSAALEAFHADRMASRILGMGDVVGLVEEVQRKVDQEKAQKLAAKVSKGQGFDLEDMRDQLSQIMGMGGLAGVLDKLPLPGVSADKLAGQMDGKLITRQVAIINSMTPRERRQPRIIDGSRRRRIAAGAGLPVQDVNRLLKQYGDMQKMMKRVSKGGGMKRMLRGFPGLGR